jgi:hypothetical protein
MYKFILFPTVHLPVIYHKDWLIIQARSTRGAENTYLSWAKSERYGIFGPIRRRYNDIPHHFRDLAEVECLPQGNAKFYF